MGVVAGAVLVADRDGVASRARNAKRWPAGRKARGRYYGYRTGVADRKKVARPVVGHMTRQASPLLDRSLKAKQASFTGGTEATGGTFAKLVSAEKPDRVPGRKRSATFQRKYAAAVKAIEAGSIAPEVKPVSSHVQCSTRTASSILAKACDCDDRFSRDTRGRVRFMAVA